MNAAQPGLRDRIARAIRDAVRLRYGPNARDVLERGGEVFLNSGEAEAAAIAALAVVQADLDAKDAEVERVHQMMDGMDEALLAARKQRDKAEADLTEILSLLAASHADAHAAEAERDWQRNLAVEILDHHTPLGHTDHPHSRVTRWRTALDQHTTHTCPRCGLATYGGPENLCPPCDLALADEAAAEYQAGRDRLRAAVELTRRIATAAHRTGCGAGWDLDPSEIIAALDHAPAEEASGT